MVKLRYGLSAAMLGLIDKDSFSKKLLEQGASEASVDENDEPKQKLLSDWLSALFIKSEGLNDELTSSCSPQDFFQLLPSLCSHSVEACNQGKLSPDNLKAGFECKQA